MQLPDDRLIRWGIHPLTGAFIPFYADTGEPVFCGDRATIGWIDDAGPRAGERLQPAVPLTYEEVFGDGDGTQ